MWKNAHAMNLFEEERWFEYRFPLSQYLGSKQVHLPWIRTFIPRDARMAVDAFGGSQSVAFLFKQMGLQTITNDLLSFNCQIGLALIENKDQTLTDADLDVLFLQNPDPSYYNLMEHLFTDLFFEQRETRFLDAFRGNVERLSNKYKRALALAVMNRSMTRKTTMGHFAHTQALSYAANPERVKRNRSLIRSLKDIFLELLLDYNAAVFDNGKENLSLQGDAAEGVPLTGSADVIYFDPPYCDSHADYQGFYHLLETYTEYWKDKNFVNGTKRYDPKRKSGFDRKVEILDAFKKTFANAQHIPCWLISYNDRSYPDIDTLTSLISEWRVCHVEKKGYRAGRGGKGSVAGSHEILIIAENK